MNRVLAIPLLLCSSLALAQMFPIDLELRADGLAMLARTGSQENLVTLELANQGKAPASCRIRWVNGPERPPEQRALLQPGEQRILHQALQRHVTRVRVHVDCQQPD